MPTLNIGNLTLGNNFPTRLAASFWQSTTPEKLRDLKKRGLDIAEIRLDLCDPPNRTAEFVRQFSREIPTLATIRLKSEGGKWDDSEESRLQLFRAVIPSADAIDIELSACARLFSGDDPGIGEGMPIFHDVVSTAKAAGKTIIASKHYTDSFPDDKELQSVCDAFYYRLNKNNSGADILKIAVAVNDPESLQRLEKFMRAHKNYPLAIMGMGKLGMQARLNQLSFCESGSVFTFVHVGEPTAPGQVLLDKAVKFKQRTTDESKFVMDMVTQKN